MHEIEQYTLYEDVKRVCELKPVHLYKTALRTLCGIQCAYSETDIVNIYSCSENRNQDRSDSIQNVGNNCVLIPITSYKCVLALTQDTSRVQEYMYIKVALFL